MFTGTAVILILRGGMVWEVNSKFVEAVCWGWDEVAELFTGTAIILLVVIILQISKQYEPSSTPTHIDIRTAPFLDRYLVSGLRKFT